MPQVVGQCRSDVDRYRQIIVVVALAVHGQRPDTPADVGEPQRSDLTGPQSQPDQHDHHGEVATPRRGAPVERRRHARQPGSGERAEVLCAQRPELQDTASDAALQERNPTTDAAAVRLLVEEIARAYEERSLTSAVPLLDDVAGTTQHEYDAVAGTGGFCATSSTSPAQVVCQMSVREGVPSEPAGANGDQRDDPSSNLKNQ